MTPAFLELAAGDQALPCLSLLCAPHWTGTTCFPVLSGQLLYTLLYSNMDMSTASLQDSAPPCPCHSDTPAASCKEGHPGMAKTEGGKDLGPLLA